MSVELLQTQVCFLIVPLCRDITDLGQEKSEENQEIIFFKKAEKVVKMKGIKLYVLLSKISVWFCLF